MPPMRRSLVPTSFRRWGAVLGAALFVVVGVVLGSVLTFTPQQPVRPVTLATAEWSPFVSPSLPDGGPVAVVVTDVMRRAGYAPDVSFTSWPMTEPSVDNGAALALFPVVPSEERRRKYLVSDPVTEFEYVLFHRADFDPDSVRRPEDLRRLRVGFVSGYDYWPELESVVGDRAVVLDDTATAFAALSSGEVDLVAEGLDTGLAHLAGPDFHGDARDVAHIDRDDPLVRSSETLHLMMRRSEAAQDLMEQFNAALADYRSSGLHATALAGLGASPPQHATVRPSGTGGTVRIAGTDHHTPSGTQVAVLSWPQATERSDSRARVKVIDGPLAGRTGRVRVVELELDGGTP